MCGKFSFLVSSEANSRVLQQMNGIILYPFTENGIPEYVHFMPKTLRKGRSLTACFKRSRDIVKDQFYVLYFNPIRWIMPDLARTMRSLDALPVEYGKNKLNFLLSYGSITFDVTPRDNAAETEETILLRVPLFLTSTCVYINVMDIPEMMGVPKLFEALDFTW